MQVFTSFFKEKTKKLPLNFLSGPNDIIIKSYDAYPLMTSPPNKLKPKNAPDFCCQSWRISALSEGLNSSLALSADTLWLEKSKPRYQLL